MTASGGTFLKRALSLLFVPLILLFHLSLATVLLSVTGVLEKALSNSLSRMTGLACEVGGVRIELLKGIEFRSFSISPQPGAPNWLFAPSALICFTRGSLPFPSNIVLRYPEISIPDAAERGGSTGGEGKLWEMISGKEPLLGEDDLFPRIAMLNGSVSIGPLAARATGFDARIDRDTGNRFVWEATARIAGSKLDGRGEINIAPEGGSYRFSVEGQKIPSSLELERLLDTMGVLDYYAAFQPDGAADLKVEGEHTPFGSPWRGTVEIALRNVDGAFVGFRDSDTGEREYGFPLRVRDMDGRIVVSMPAGDVEVEALRGVACNGRVQIDASVQDGESDTDFEVTIKGAEIDVKALPGESCPFMAALEESLPLTAQVLEDLRVSGTTDIVCRISGNSEYDVDLVVDLGLRSAKILPAVFPAPVESIEGEISIVNGNVSFPSLTGRLGRSILRCSGAFEQEEGLSLLLSSGNLELDGGLRDALLSSLGNEAHWFESLQLSKGISAEVDVRDREGSDPDLRIRLDLDGCTASSDRLPVDLESLRGVVEARSFPSGRWRLEARELKGSHEGSELKADIVMEEGRLKRCDIVGKNQAVTPQLRSYLSEKAPDFHDFLDAVEFEGSADFRISGQDDGFLLELTPRFSSFSGPPLPFRFSSLQGRICYLLGGSRISIEKLVLGLGQGRFIVDQATVDLRNGYLLLALTGNAYGLPLAADLGDGMDPSVREIWNGLGASGMISLKNVDLHAHVVPGEEIRDVRGSLAVGFRDVAIESPFPLSALSGDALLDFQWPAPGATGRIVRGSLANTSFILAGRLFSNLAADYAFSGESLVVPSLAGRFCGGGLRLGNEDLVLGLDSPWPFKGRLLLEDADLKMILDRNRYSLKDIAGRLDVDLVFFGEVENIDRLSGAGTASVERGSLWRLPIFSQLWEKIREIRVLGKPPTFTSGQAGFTISGDRIDFQEVELVSTVLALDGEGYLTLSEVDLDVVPTFAPALVDSIPLIGPAINFITSIPMNLIKNNLVRFTIRGPYENINVAYAPFLKRIFGREEIRKLGRCPAPVPFEPGERF